MYSENMHQTGYLHAHPYFCTRYGVRVIDFVNSTEPNSNLPKRLIGLISRVSSRTPWPNVEAGIWSKPYTRFRVRRWSCKPQHRRRHVYHVTDRTVISLTPARPLQLSQLYRITPNPHAQKHKSHFSFHCLNFAHLSKYPFLW